MSRTAALIGLAALAPPAPPVPAPPPVIATPNPQQIVEYRPGRVMCGDAEVAPLRQELPSPGLGWGQAQAVELSFRIDETGRPLGIALDRTRPAPTSQVGDIEPSLAAWRFPAGAPKAECRISYLPLAAPIEQTGKEALFRYAGLARGLPGTNQSLVRRAFEQGMPEGSTCKDRPLPRQLTYPAFDKVKQAPGTADFVMLNFDVSPEGRSTNVRLIGSSGNRALEKTSIEAVGASRWAPGARTGCVSRFSNFSRDPLEAPPVPDRTHQRPEKATCPEGMELPPKTLSRLVFPAEFNRRRIEGWAILTYDVAPWGATGNVKIAASEPAARFGEQAAMIVRGAQLESGPGYSGCTTLVRFKLAGRGQAESQDEP